MWRESRTAASRGCSRDESLSPPARPRRYHQMTRPPWVWLPAVRNYPGGLKMPSVDENRRLWTDWDWRADGYEWSEAWGTAADQWASTILPRIFSLLPASSILEI